MMHWGNGGHGGVCLRRVRRLPAPEVPTPRVSGIDDWAKRKGRTYGTIVVDLEHGGPVDVVEDRAAETVATWLQAHPEVTIVARDRAEAYASGVTQGAPDAVQVADRWHLLKHVREAIEAELHQRPTLPWHPPAPATAEAISLGTPADLARAVLPPIYPDTAAGRRAEAARQARRTQRLQQYQQACTLRQQGLPMPLIARQVGGSTRTLCRGRAAATVPERQRRPGAPGCLDPSTTSLQPRWEAGCHHATHLWRDLQAQGFAGSYHVVAMYVAP